MIPRIPRSFTHLMRLECYAFNRWRRTLSPLWLRLGAACNRAVKDHPEYRGV
ncbi:hypothetical protein FRUB_10301 [Fimbriiglobus ruber]|uniref:Uncharacterized protein n=1 Tax=Fimbriiglobus ruber TaxID=1908690 RepID=A0A225CY79_9BACT|nr:hypothetical protein FRUB_10301 [Fimbriiglobus ruber]